MSPLSLLPRMMRSTRRSYHQSTEDKKVWRDEPFIKKTASVIL